MMPLLIENCLISMQNWLKIQNVMLYSRPLLTFLPQHVDSSIFFADSPRLMKTAVNCLYNSGSGTCSRFLKNDGQYLLFRHIADLFYKDQASALHVLPKLTLEHVVLSSFSKMKVKLATQVLSHSVAIALEESKQDEVPGNAEFCRVMNSIFECTCVRSRTENIHKKSEFIKPYTTLNEDRFAWLLIASRLYLMREVRCSYHSKQMRV